MEWYDYNDPDDLWDIGWWNLSIDDYLDSDEDLYLLADTPHMSESAIETRIMAMQVKLILNASSEIDEFLWVHLYSESFRKIVTDHPEWSLFQVQHALYLPHLYQQK